MRTITVLATDYDRTLTDEALELDPATVEALQAARAVGLRIVVVSGRDARFLRSHVGAVADLIVAENGAFLVEQGAAPEPLFRAWPGRERLLALGIPIELAEASGSVDAAHAALVERAVSEAALELRLERNRDRLMLLPAGVDKGTALAVALARLEVSPADCAAVGDGENDVSLLAAAGHRVAVANAVDSVKALAHEITRSPGGAGVREWLRERWLPARAAASPPRGAGRRG